MAEQSPQVVLPLFRLSLRGLSQFQNRAAIRDKGAGAVQEPGADGVRLTLGGEQIGVPFSPPAGGDVTILRHGISEARKRFRGSAQLPVKKQGSIKKGRPAGRPFSYPSVAPDQRE